jgi:NitT/TauT family transport system substrate-binding protein
MVAMPHEDGMAALLTGATEVKSQAAQLPFSVQEMESGKAHLLLTSPQVVGGPSNISVAITTDGFRTENPKLYAAVVAGLNDAIAYINADKQAAAELYVQHEPQKKGVEWIYGILQNPDLIAFTPTPHGTGKFTDFMYQMGLLKTHAASWEDLYWTNSLLAGGN